CPASPGPAFSSRLRGWSSAPARTSPLSAAASGPSGAGRVSVVSVAGVRGRLSCTAWWSPSSLECDWSSGSGVLGGACPALVAGSGGNSEGWCQSGGFRAIVRNHRLHLVPGLWLCYRVAAGTVLLLAFGRKRG